MSFDAYNGADVRYLLNTTLYYYSSKVYFANKGELQVELSSSSYQQAHPYTYSPMSNVWLKVAGMDGGRINKEFFVQCLKDIESVGSAVAHNLPMTRLIFHHFLRHQNINAKTELPFDAKTKLTILYTCPDSVRISQLPFSYSKQQGYASPATPLQFRQMLCLAMHQTAYSAASEVYVMEGLRPQDLLDKVNP